MSSATPHTSRHFNLRLLLILVGVVAGLSFIPLGRAPSSAKWLQAYIRGQGKPHFAIQGTPATRIHELYKRVPELRPEWGEIAPEENGYLLLRDFVNSEAASRLELSLGLKSMLQDESKWNQEAIRSYAAKNQQDLDELRRIALLPERSAKGKSPKEIIDAEAYKKLADVLLLLFQSHLQANQMAEAWTDFSALYGFAAHIDRHEVANFVDKTTATQIRLTPHDVLCKALQHAPEHTDWLPWIRVIQNEPSYGLQMQAAWRGEAWARFQLSPVWATIRQKNNRIWDFTEFEDAFARRVLESAKAYANASTLADLDALKPLSEEVRQQEAMLSQPAQAMLQNMQISTRGWEREAIRAETRYNLTLAALQLLQSENEEGPIPAADDMRLGSLAIDPSTGNPFVFDPAKRQLAVTADSVLAGLGPVHLPTW